MKLLFLINSLGSGGAQRQMVTIAPLLKEKGMEVEFLCYYRDTFFAAPLDKAGIKVHWLPASNPLARIWKIRLFIRQGNYDVVISFLNTPDLLNCLSAIGGHTWRVVCSERSAKEEFFVSRRGKLTGWLKRYSDTIVCNSENARQMWLKYYPQYQEKLKVIYNIVALPAFTSVYVPRRGGKTHLLVAASYQYLKNPVNVIEAVNLLTPEEKAKLILDWYGMKQVAREGTRAYEEASGLVNRYHLGQVIRLNDPTPSIIEKMKEADVIGLFSSVEGLPNAICEAMSLGKPVMMSRVSDYAVLVDEKNGVLCDAGDVLSIRKALQMIINQWSDEQLLEKGKNSQAKAGLLFGKERVSGQWMKIIRR